jgi:hypothetical protein
MANGGKMFMPFPRAKGIDPVTIVLLPVYVIVRVRAVTDTDALRPGAAPVTTADRFAPTAASVSVDWDPDPASV